jgi:TPR repeat protein
MMMLNKITALVVGVAALCASLFLFFWTPAAEEPYFLEKARLCLGRKNYACAHSLLLKALDARQDVDEARYLLALMELNGLGKKVDIDAGMAYLAPLLAQQSPKAMLEAGVVHSQEESSWFNEEKAFYYFKAAADKGDILSMRNLGLIYAKKNPADIAASNFWLEKARQLGLKEAAYLMALNALLIDNFKTISPETLDLLKEAVLDDEPRALLLLGSIHWKFQPEADSISQAGECLKKAAQSLPEAAYRYSLWLEDQPDKALESWKWLNRAASEGCIPAQFMVGLKFEQGAQGLLLQDKCVGWYEKAAQNGHARAMNRLGILYARGSYGLERNDTIATDYFEQASAQYLPDAQNNLALMILYSDNPDYQRAYDLMRQAAAQGYRPAQNNIALLSKNYPYLFKIIIGR